MTARILVVDDNAQNRLVAQAHLETAGFEVDLADSGAEAIAAFSRRPPDLVLLDILMPQMDGFETCRRLRALPGGQQIPIAFLTALSDLETHGRALDAGAEDMLTKPINRTELLMRVRSLLALRYLRRDVEGQVATIREQHEALLRVQAQKDELLALIVHDLKSPLTAMLLELSWLERIEIENRMARSVRSMRSATEQMNRMVMNLLDLARSDDGRLEPAVKEVDVGQVVAQACEGFARRAVERHQHLRVDIAKGLPPVIGDPDLLGRIVENLVDNALKYAGSGGEITVDVRLVDGDLDVRVADDGPGIPAEWRDRVFDRYVRLDRDADQAARSSRGLGLAFCKLAAEAMGGSIGVADGERGGAAFWVRLPAVPAVAG